MDINTDIEKISKKAESNITDVRLIIRLINEILGVLPRDIDYKTLLFNHKDIAAPLVSYAYNQYTAGVRADAVLSSIKNILQSIEKEAGYSKELRLITDLMDVQFIGIIMAEQAKNINAKLLMLQTKLNQDETLMKNFIDSFQQLIFLTDTFGNITTCNSAAEKYFSLIHDDPYPKLLSLFDYNYLDTDEFLQTYITRGRREIRLMNGSILRIEVRALKGSGIKVINYLIILDEITNKDSLKIIHEPVTTFMKLTKTELKICDLIYDGMRNKEIAAYMSVSEDTIKNHRKAIRSKLMLDNKKVNLYFFLRENYQSQK